MTEEILKTLDKIYYNYENCDIEKYLDKIKDYITNLQHIEEQHKKLNGELRKENKRLKEELKNRPIVDFTFDVYEELENYKSRCEKAIEYLKYQLDNLDFEKDTKAKMLCAMTMVLLQGSDEE